MFEQDHLGFLVEFGSSHIVGVRVSAFSFCEFVDLVGLGLNLSWYFAGDCL